MLLDATLVDLDAGRILGVEQGVQVTSRVMRLVARPKPGLALRSGLRSAVRDIGIVGVERVARGVTPEPYCLAVVGGVYVS